MAGHLLQRSVRIRGWFAFGIGRSVPESVASELVAGLSFRWTHIWIRGALVTLAGYCVHSTVVPAIVPIFFFSPTEEMD